MNVAVVLEVFPQSSVAVKMTVSAPVAPQRSLRPVLLWLQVTPPHASLATAPPLLESQAAKAAAFPAPSHSTVSSAAGVSMLGSVLSSMVNVAVVLEVFPQSSVAVKVTVSAPVAPQRSLKPALLWLQVTPPHASLATAPPLLESQAAKAAALPAPSHSTVSSAATVSMLGSVVS